LDGQGVRGDTAVVNEPALTFAGLLRRLRAETRLTQEELAEAAGLSPRSVSDLERGINRTARKETAVSLARALGLPEAVAELFVAAARGRGLADDVVAASQGTAPGAFAAAATRGLPRDVASFTGRQAELDRLSERLDGLAPGGGVVGICAIGGMAGVGKTTLAVHAAHRLAGGFPDGQFYLPLHAHTRGQRPVDPADALSSLLLTAGVPATQVPPGLEARAARWRDHVAGKRILLLLDDAASHEQVRPLLPGTGGSLVLLTSRRRLTALEDAAVISLDILPPGEAAELLTRLTARDGIHAADPAVGEITRLCGYLPLAIGLIASQLRHHPAQTTKSVVASLAAATDRPELMRAENLSVAAAFDLSYQDLSPGQQRLFRRLGLIPGPTFDAYAAAALDGASLGEARRQLDELYDQHLITEPALGRYQLHDLLREHARALAAADDQADRVAAAGRVLDYYMYSAMAAGRHFAPRSSSYRRTLPGNPSAHAPDLSTIGQSAAWLEAERVNLHAAADDAATSGHFRHAVAIPAAMGGFLAARGHWDQSAALHQSALAAAHQAGDRLGEAGALSTLGALQRESGSYPAAAASLARALALYRDIGDRPGQADVLNELGFLRVLTGDYRAAAASHRQALLLARGAGDRRGEAHSVSNLGLVQQLTGDHAAAAASQQQALAVFEDLGHLHDQAYALNSLGVVQEETGDFPAAAASQQQALAMFNDLGHRLGQAHALNDLGLVQQQTGDYPAAAASHQQALTLFEDLGHRLGQAEALNRLGELSLRTSATAQARDQHTRALAIARDISAAPEQARALDGIGNSHLQEGCPSQAVAPLRQALTIYQRIGAPGAERIQETLRSPDLPASVEGLDPDVISPTPG
ncbi:MAG TPA: tetratricopeptide repeat protein, partial [Streptosporangiaceae bacterium]|nr:tetratricopeptide repeat protein [Streptosporangiaceae bacterium]